MVEIQELAPVILLDVRAQVAAVAAATMISPETTTADALLDAADAAVKQQTVDPSTGEPLNADTAFTSVTKL